MRLHGFFRSSAAQRVRIALNLKGMTVEHISHHLPKGEHKAPGYVGLNPQGLVPSLELDDGTILTQSLAIIEWLEETHPKPALLPADPLRRAKARAFALVVACEIHPLQNLGTLNRLRKAGLAEDAVKQWGITLNMDGLAACEKLIAAEPGPFCFGNAPTIADVFLVPQLGNARRNGADVSGFRRLMQAEAACMKIEAFAAAEPDRQPDAPKTA
jgi:maleylpyruvate isomerase